MVEIVPFREEFLPELENLSTDLYLKLTEHGDVLSDTAVAALSDGEFTGVGFLMKGPSFRVIDRRLPYYHINMEFYAEPEAPEEVEASEYLILKLIEKFEEIQEMYPDKRLILRNFAAATDTAYVEFLINLGFTPGRVMLQMEQYLVRETDGIFPAAADYFKDPEFHVEIPDFDDPTLDPVYTDYYEKNEACFLVPDSEDELLYRVNACGALVYLLMRGEEVISSVTVWNRYAPDEFEPEGALMATENIFTAPEYQDQGYMSYLLSRVLFDLGQADASKANLNVYADDQPAVSLYGKLGYETVDEIFEMQYESRPLYLPY